MRRSSVCLASMAGRLPASRAGFVIFIGALLRSLIVVITLGRTQDDLALAVPVGDGKACRIT